MKLGLTAILAGSILCLVKAPPADGEVSLEQTVRVLAGDAGIRALQREFGESHRDPLHETPLPVVDIRLKSAQINRLNADLPASGKDMKNARVILEGDAFDARVRYRGDFFDHWGGVQKSWRVNLRRGEHWHGMRRFNLINEKFESTNLSHLMAYEVARRLDLPVPIVFPVHLRINGKFMGQYNCYEQIGESTPARLYLPSGDIIKGDWDNSTGQPPLNVFRRIEPWFKVVEGDGIDRADFGPTLKLQLLGRRDRPARLEEVDVVLDTDNFIRHHLLSLFIRYRNNDLQHNHLHYRHPRTHRLSNICWDIYFGNAGELHPDSVWTPVQKILFADPRLVARRNDLLGALLDSELSPESLMATLERFHGRLRLDYGRDEYKGDYWGSETRITPVTGEAMDRDRDLIAGIIRDSHSHLSDWLARGSRLEAVRKGDDVHLTVSGPVRSVVRAVRWSGTGEIPVLRTTPLPWTLTAAREARHLTDPGIGRYRDGRWEILPCSYRFGVTGDVRDIEIVWVNPVTGAETVTRVTGGEVPDMATGTIARQKELFCPAKSTVSRIGPGEVAIDTTTTINADRIIIEPGTVIRMAPGASLILNGELSAQGTAESGILVTGQRWGSMVLRGPRNSLAHCRFENGGDVLLDGYLHMGMVSAYGVPVEMTDCTFTGATGDDGLNVKEAPCRLVRCDFVGNGFDGCDLDFSLAEVRSCRFIDNGNDGLDLGTGTAHVTDCEFRDNGDKGLSFGERSHSLVERSTFSGNVMGVAVKDQSRPRISDCLFENNGIAVNAYRKKPEYGGGAPTLVGCRFSNNRERLRHDGLSRIRILKGGTR